MVGTEIKSIVSKSASHGFYVPGIQFSSTHHDVSFLCGMLLLISREGRWNRNQAREGESLCMGAEFMSRGNCACSPQGVRAKL